MKKNSMLKKAIAITMLAAIVTGSAEWTGTIPAESGNASENYELSDIFTITADAATTYNWVYPVKNPKVSSGYGYRTLNGKKEFHTGTDWISTTGCKDIYAVADGKIILASYTQKTNTTNWNAGFGNYIVLQLNDGSIVIYGHLDPQKIISENTTVKAGQKIAIMGKTGCSTGIHVHVELRPKKYNSVKDGVYKYYGQQYTLNPNPDGGTVRYSGKDCSKDFVENGKYIFQNSSGVYIGTSGNKIANNINVVGANKSNATVFVAHYDKSLNAWIFCAEKNQNYVLNFYADDVKSGTNICLYTKQKKVDPTQYIQSEVTKGAYRLKCAQNPNVSIEVQGYASEAKPGVNIRAYSNNNDSTQVWNPIKQ